MVSYSLPAMEQDLRTVLPGIDIIYDYETIVFDYDFVNKRISIVKEVEDFSESIPTLLRYPLENEDHIKAHAYSKIRKGILRFDEMNSKTSEFKFLFKMKNNQNEWKNCILFSKKISTEDRIARHAIGIITVLDNEWWSDRLFQWVRREEFGEVVEVLADMYHAVYILNVEEETFETIKYPWNSPDREFGVVDFKTGMESLIEKVIPEKRKAFFELYGLLKLKEAMKDGPDKIYHEFQMEGLDGYIWMSVTAISFISISSSSCFTLISSNCIAPLIARKTASRSLSFAFIAAIISFRIVCLIVSHLS